MKKLSLILASLFIFSASSFADDVDKGQKVYLKVLKQRCGVSGAKFAIYHTQNEWTTMKEEGKIIEGIKEKCPKVPDLSEEQQNYLFAFFNEFASDSGNVPSCGD